MGFSDYLIMILTFIPYLFYSVSVHTLKNIISLTTFSMTFFMNAVRSFYAVFITFPLKTFYLVGPIWGNLDHSQICFEITQVDSAFWAFSPINKATCEQLIDRKYQSLEATVICIAYFLSVTLVICYFIYRCCFLKPLIKEIRGIVQHN